MEAPNKSVIRSAGDTAFTFVALYFTTLFSLDTWDAARASPFRAPSTNMHYRPAQPIPSSDSYQGQMYRPGRNNGRRDVGRVPSARDSRAPLGMGASCCGGCIT